MRLWVVAPRPNRLMQHLRCHEHNFQFYFFVESKQPLGTDSELTSLSHQLNETSNSLGGNRLATTWSGQLSRWAATSLNASVLSEDFKHILTVCSSWSAKEDKAWNTRDMLSFNVGQSLSPMTSRSPRHASLPDTRRPVYCSALNLATGAKTATPVHA